MEVSATDKKTGLYSHCNRGLGCVHEDIGILTEMITYLVKHSKGGTLCLVEE
jgi:hypothetical protein